MRMTVSHLVLVLGCAVFITSCGCNGDGWDVSAPPGTGVSPETGSYTFSQRGSFSVVQDLQTGDKFVRFASDSYRFDLIPVRDGRFERAWGQIGGTHCPTDSYRIAGVFETPTCARGQIQYAADCQVLGPSVEFVAERR